MRLVETKWSQKLYTYDLTQSNHLWVILNNSEGQHLWSLGLKLANKGIFVQI